MIYLILILTSLGFGYCKFVTDGIQFKFDETPFIDYNLNFWKPSESWNNKWKNGDKDQGERFWGSSRWFVWLTDAWHLFTTLQYFLIFVSSVCIILSNDSNLLKCLYLFIWWCLGLLFFEMLFKRL